MSEIWVKINIHDWLGRILTDVLLRFIDQFFHLKSLLLLCATQLGELFEHVSLTMNRMAMTNTFFPFVFAYWSISSKCSFSFESIDCKSRMAFFLVSRHNIWCLHLCSQLLIVDTRSQILEHTIQFGDLLIQVLKIDSNIFHRGRQLVIIISFRPDPNT